MDKSLNFLRSQVTLLKIFMQGFLKLIFWLVICCLIYCLVDAWRCSVPSLMLSTCKSRSGWHIVGLKRLGCQFCCDFASCCDAVLINVPLNLIFSKINKIYFFLFKKKKKKKAKAVWELSVRFRTSDSIETPFFFFITKEQPYSQATIYMDQTNIVHLWFV